MSEWQPANTVPHDEVVQIWLPTMRLVRMGRFNTKNNFKNVHGWSVWLTSGGAAATLGKKAYPTLWQPLASPPQIEAEMT